MSSAPTSDDVSKSLSDRARAVLYAVVTEFTQSGEPVGSRTLSTRYGLDLSAATIRNVLKDLDDAGYLTQPHTSAGRVPTLAAFRLFIDALMKVRQLSKDQHGRIVDLFSQNLERGELLRESGRLLSELSGQPAVILRSRNEVRSVTKVRFIPNRPGELLSVIIFDDGSVENRFIEIDDGIEFSRLERLHNLLDEVTSDRTLDELFGHLAELARRERAELGALGQLGDQLLGSAIGGAIGRQEVIVEGRSTLLAAGADPERVKGLMVALDDREQLAVLLDRTLHSDRVQVFLGQDDEAEPGTSPLSVVAAPYAALGAQAGVVGTVGPTRMDYPGLVPLVETMAVALTRSLGGDDVPSTRPDVGQETENTRDIANEGPR